MPSTIPQTSQSQLMMNVKPVAKQGVWGRDPGQNYVMGYDYLQSVAYCALNKSDIASKSQLIDAGNMGYSNCIAGWLQDQQAGFVSDGTNCGVKGYNAVPSNDPNVKLATYCYGPIPSDNNVNGYIIG